MEFPGGHIPVALSPRVTSSQTWQENHLGAVIKPASVFSGGCVDLTDKRLSGLFWDCSLLMLLKPFHPLEERC